MPSEEIPDLHILQNVHSLQSAKGGPSRTVTQLTAALRDIPHTQVSVFCTDRTVDDRNIITGNAYLQICRHLGMNRMPAIVHDNGVWLPCNALANFAAIRSHTPYIISPHGMLEPWSIKHHRFRKRLAMTLYQSSCLKNAAAFHATSREEAVGIRSIGLLQPVAVIGNGIEAAPCIERCLPASRIALFLSRLHEKKGVLELITAWSRLRPQGWILRIVGPDDGGHRQIVEKMIADHGLQSSIQLRDEVSDQEKWREYNQAELFILPTHSENFGLVIGEALASGVPVITTTGTPWKEIARRQCGWIIDPDVDQLCNALHAATSHSRGQLLAMGETGRHWIPAEFSWRHIARQMHEFYMWITGGMKTESTPAFIV
ncbi:MAG: glycosyltransferase [Steroidobacter sp.]